MREIKLDAIISWQIAVAHGIKTGFDDANRREFFYIPDDVSAFNKAYWNKSCVIVTDAGEKTLRLRPRKEYENYFAERRGYDYLRPTTQKGNRDDFLEMLYQKGTGFVNGKSRITTFYENVSAHSKKECIEFLKKEHGIGGGYFSHLYNQPWTYNTDAKGVTFGYYDEKNNMSYELTYTWAEYDKVLRKIIPPRKEMLRIETDGQYTLFAMMDA